MLVFLKYGMAGEIQGFDTGLRWFPGGAEPGASSSCRINTLKIERCALLDRFAENGIDYQSFNWYPLGLKLDMESPGKLVENLSGFIHIQEELSMVPPWFSIPSQASWSLTCAPLPAARPARSLR